MALTIAAQLARQGYCYYLGQEWELQGTNKPMSPFFGLINLPTAVDDGGCDVFVGPITRTSLYQVSILETLSSLTTKHTNFGYTEKRLTMCGKFNGKEKGSHRHSIGVSDP